MEAKGKASFPRDTLKRALTIAESIERNYAGKAYDRLDLAKSLDWSPNSSGFRTLIISSGRYGLTEGGYSADRIALTPLGSSIVSPTKEGETNVGLRQALTTPELFARVLRHYDKKAIPRQELLKSALRKEFGVAPDDVDACYEVLLANLKDYGIIENIKGNDFLQLDKLSAPSVMTPPSLGDETEEPLPPTAPVTAMEPPKPRVFISHSKNMKILTQLKQMLDFGGFEHEVAVERETTAIPIPDKIFGLLRKCNCAVINVSADEQEKAGESYGINQNVLIEIGAAFLLYNKKVILLVDKRVTLPSNLQGLNLMHYEGEELSWETGMRLQTALTEFRRGL